MNLRDGQVALAEMPVPCSPVNAEFISDGVCGGVCLPDLEIQKISVDVEHCHPSFPTVASTQPTVYTVTQLLRLCNYNSVAILDILVANMHTMC